jgi:hypothetical protein
MIKQIPLHRSTLCESKREMNAVKADAERVISSNKFLYIVLLFVKANAK